MEQPEFFNWQDCLPESFAQVLTLIGSCATYRLVQDFGGLSVPISKKARGFWYQQLVQSIGKDNTHRLQHALHNQRELYVPKCDDLMRKIRNQNIQQQFDALSQTHSGVESVRRLERQYRLSERQVWSILNQAQYFCTQMHLFKD